MKGAKSKSDNKSKLAVNKKPTKAAPKKAGKAVKDPNKPKRPASAFFVFMEDFREIYKKEHPKNKAVSAEKAPYVAKADKRKIDYEKNMKAYNKKQAEGPKEEEEEEEVSDKSVSEVNDEDDDDEDDEEEDDE
ncbi:hypothetical protein ACFE04_013862 [Oxalis oulophora]